MTDGNNPFRVLSLGAGVQSSVLALLLAQGDERLTEAGYPRPDAAIFADTGWEPNYVYEHLDWLEAQLPYPVHRVSAGNIRENLYNGVGPQGRGYVDIPLFLINGDASDGMSKRQCTDHYKVTPIYRELRAILGYEPRARIPKGAVQMMMGISTDEILRVKPSRRAWVENAYPLIDVGMGRADCHAWFSRAYPDRQLPRSACVICPFHSDRQWLELESREPDSYADAVRFDAWMRTDAGRATFEFLRGEPYLHSKRTPLGEAVARVKEARDLQPELDGFTDECEGYCGV